MIRNNDLAVIAAANVALFVLIGYFAPTVLVVIVLTLACVLLLVGIFASVRAFVRARRTTRAAAVVEQEARTIRRLARQRARQNSPIKHRGGGFSG